MATRAALLLLAGAHLLGACASTGTAPPTAATAPGAETPPKAPPAAKAPPEPDAGFNAATIDTFSRSVTRFELAGLPKADAQRLESLREIGEGMRALGARDLQSLYRTLGAQAGPVVRALGSNGRDATAVIWPAFFQSSVLTVGHGRSGRAEVGFYNPLVDSWLITQWRLDGRRWTLTDAALRSGESVRGQPLAVAPAWQSANASIAVALPQTYAATLNAYERAHPRFETAPAPPLARGDSREANTVRARVTEMRLSVLHLVDDRAATAAILRLLLAIRSGSAAETKSAIARPADDAIAAALALSQPQRDALLPFAVLRRRDGGRSVAVLTRSATALILLIEFGTGDAAGRIESISLISLGFAGVGGA